MSIFCSQCGTENRDDSLTCFNCHAPIARPVYSQGRGPGADQEYSQEYQQPNQSRFRLGSVVVGLICVVYLLNPTAGILELLPDNLPIIGNLDEAAAVTGLLMALSNLGIIPWRRA